MLRQRRPSISELLTDFQNFPGKKPEVQHSDNPSSDEVKSSKPKRTVTATVKFLGFTHRPTVTNFDQTIIQLGKALRDFELYSLAYIHKKFSASPLLKDCVTTLPSFENFLQKKAFTIRMVNFNLLQTISSYFEKLEKLENLKKNINDASILLSNLRCDKIAESTEPKTPYAALLSFIKLVKESIIDSYKNPATALFLDLTPAGESSTVRPTNSNP